MARLCVLICLVLFAVSLVPPAFGYDLNRLSILPTDDAETLALPLEAVSPGSSDRDAAAEQLFAAR